MIHASVQTAPEEHVEYVVLVVLLILLVPHLLLPWNILLRAPLVVYHTLLWVTQTGICLGNLFERLFSLGVAILIGVDFKGSLFIGFLDVIIRAGALSEPQNLIVVLLLEDELASLELHQTQLGQRRAIKL
jgi:hypothetical protein